MLLLIVAVRPITPISSPGLLLLLTVAIAAVGGGVAPALGSAAIAVGFAAVDASSPGQVLTYTPESLSRLLVTVFVAPAMAVLVGSIQARLVAARQEAARRQSDDRQRAMTEGSTDAVIVADAAGTIVAANPASTTIYGYSQEELVGTPVVRLAPPARQGQFAVDLARFLASGVRPPAWDGVEAMGRHASGRLVPIEVTVGAYGAGPDRRVVWVIRDRTRQKELQAQLLQSSKMDAIGRLAGGVAHDFNNVLTAIVGSASLLRDSVHDEGGQELLGIIEDASARAARLTRQLLAFGRRQMLERRVFDVGDEIDGISPLLERIVGEDVRLVTRRPPGETRVLADPAQIEQVIVNLAVNAREAMPNGGRLTIEVAPVELDADYVATHPEVSAGPFVMLAVSDTGLGMDNDTKERLFEPFFTTKADSGTGLGLATVYGIVKQSGGSINVYSEIGKGTVFKVYLPQVFAAVDRRADGDEGALAPLHTARTILLAEDDPDVRAIAVKALERHGYRLLVADDGQSALSIANDAAGPIDLLLSDVVMPGMSGVELARRLADVRPGVRVLFMSGYTENAVIHQGVGDGVAFVAKPFTPAGLLAKVDATLNAPVV